MIIHSTVLSTLAEVREVFGNNTTWISHSGYMLRGATSGVTANSASKTGGNDDAIVPYHTHSMIANGAHTHGIYFSQGGNTGGGVNWTPANCRMVGTYDWMVSAGSHSHTINYAGTNGNTTNANIPNYKSVYIWERTV